MNYKKMKKNDLVKELESQKSKLEGLHSLQIEKSKIEKQFYQAAKLASIGELAGGIGHELNNPLTVVQSSVDLIQNLINEGKIDNEDVKIYISYIKDSVQRMATITAYLKVFGKEKPGEIVEQDIHTIIDSSFTLFGTQLESLGIDVTKDYCDDDVNIFCDSYQIEQVFINFLSNAKDALCHSERKEIKIKTEIKKDKLFIYFEDTGCGIDKDKIDKIFDPFYTTKDLGKGTGLGLSISHGIIEEHRGTIEVKNKKEGGIRFIISLPLSSACLEEMTGWPNA